MGDRATMIKYNVGDLIECPSGVYIIIEAENNPKVFAWEQRYKVVSQSGEIKRVELYHLTHRCI